jgi:2'-hydroxyisoflavone reductase
MVEMLAAIKGTFSGDALFTWVDADFLESSDVESWTDLPVWVPARGEYAAFHLVSTEKAVAAGLRFRPLADTARDTVAWCRDARGPDYDFDRGTGLTREREAQLLRAWHQRAEVGE